MVILLPESFPVGMPTREWLLLRLLDEGDLKRSNPKYAKNEIVCERWKIQELKSWLTNTPE